MPLIRNGLLVSGVIKWLMSPAERKTAKSASSEKFKKVFHGQLDTAWNELTRQLDATSHQFQEAAERLVRPLIFKAQTVNRLATLHLKVVRRLNEHSQKSLAALPQPR